LVALFGTNIGPSQPTTADGSSGSLPTFLSGVTVTFNGIPAPLLYADTGQINAVVPYELAGQNSAVLTLLQHGSPVASVTLSVAAVSPAFFTLDEDGVGHVIAFNEDGSLNAEFNPAPAGSMLTLFLTGCGPTNPVSLTGQILPPSQTGQLALPVAGSIQGTLTSVGYAGPAPGLVSGVCIIQLRVPVGVSSSAQAGLSVQIGTEWTPERVIVAVGGS
jgi:uncharacterized protein (TIGR03437 family)